MRSGCFDKVIEDLKAEGRQKEIQETVEALKKGNPDNLPVPEELAYVSGSLMDDYLHDMAITQKFAMLNRKAMADVIVREMKLSAKSVHQVLCFSHQLISFRLSAL